MLPRGVIVCKDDVPVIEESTARRAGGQGLKKEADGQWNCTPQQRQEGEKLAISARRSPVFQFQTRMYESPTKERRAP